MRKPNFFLLGAPKSGTSSLFYWLMTHPHIFGTNPKEPHFFNTGDGNRYIKSLEAYNNLFKYAGPKHKAVGEASVWYLSSPEAVPNILNYNPKASFLVCLRNPVEMAVSLHHQMVAWGYENITDFSAAWDRQEERKLGKHIPRNCNEPRQLLYGQACSIGEQVSRLLHYVSRDNVCFIVVDDLKRDPRTHYLRVLHFLGVDDDNKKIFPKLNVSRPYTNIFSNMMVKSFYKFKKKLPYPVYYKLLLLLEDKRKNRTSTKTRPVIANYESTRLKKYFENDIENLSRTLNRDLRHWVKY